MAGEIPTPRSYQSLLGDMIDGFLSRFGLRGLRVGGPILSILEDAAQSDLRGSQDIFNLLDATDIDRATGLALDRKALDEDLSRFPIKASTGFLTIIDNSFTKISSKVYPGAAAPNAGTTVLKVSDASDFPSTGQVYIGRNTSNFEGPLSYTSPVAAGTYWTITLTSPTLRFHDVNETVTVAQGGDRVVAAGTIVRTSLNNVGPSVNYSITNPATLVDGETEIDGVSIICQQPGTIGNVIAGAISEFSSPPFVGATCTNPLPIDNGQPTENDNSLRERIKATRQSRARGTPLALITNAKGVVAPDENKSVVSANVFQPEGEPAILFIDDGTGYEEVDESVALDVIVDEALGGEQYLKLSTTLLPVTQAFVTSTSTTPFAISPGAKLAIKVAGVLSEHTFENSEFRNISNATAYEVVSAINGDPDLLFSARTANNGTKVVLFARTDSNEDIEVVTPDTGIDANTYFNYPVGTNYTLRLYKNDQLLFKDGKTAIVVSAPQSNWSPTIASGVYLKLKVDSTPAMVYKIVDADFINAGTAYTTVDKDNSLESWASVLNSRIPGIDCTVSAGRLQLVSNRGASGVAAITISQPSGGDKDTDGVTVVNPSNNLVQKGVFTSTIGLTASGRNNDYTLNRNTGELKLSVPLAEDDVLSAGTLFTRAYIQSDEIASGVITLASNANLFFVVDGDASIVSTGLTAATELDLTNPAGERRRYATNPSVAIFQNVQVGDWLALWDPAFTVRGAWRVSFVDPAFTYFEVERNVAHVNELGIAPAANGMVFVRTAAPLQQVVVSSGANRLLSSIATDITDGLEGATASAYRSTYLRVTTDTFGSNGSIFLATADTVGQQLLLPRGTLKVNSTNHLPAIESANREAGTPNFTLGTISTLPGTLGTQLTQAGATLDIGGLIYWPRRLYGTNGGFGNLVDQWTPIDSVAAGTYDLRKTMAGAALSDPIISVSPYSISYEDNLSVILDRQDVSKNYNIPLWRKSSPVPGQNYTAVNLELLDSDNGDADFSAAFGDDDALFFQDWAVFMHARAKSHGGDGGSAPPGYSDNKALLWRYTLMGAAGNRATVAYANPIAANQPITATTSNGALASVEIRLPSGAARGGLSLQDNTRFTTAIVVGVPDDDVTYSYSDLVASYTRVSNVVTVTTTGNHGYAAGDTVYTTTADVNFPNGPKTIVTTPAGNTFTYNEAGINAGPVAGTCSSASAAPDFSSVVVGDVVNIGENTGFDESAFGAFRVTAKTSTTFTVKRVSGEQVANATPVSLNGASNLQFYPIDTANSSAAQIATWVNANIPSIVTAAAVENGGGNPGIGVIDRSTEAEYLEGYGNTTAGTPVLYYSLVDGINWVKDCDITLSPAIFSFKNDVNTDLVSNSDFDNEEFRLVPILAKGIVNCLSSPGTSGFYAGSEEKRSSRAAYVQLSSLTAGSDGSVQVTGGTANSVGPTVMGSGSQVDSTYTKVSIPATQAKGLVGDQWCALQGSAVQPKDTLLTSASSIVSIQPDGNGNWEIKFDVDLWNHVHQDSGAVKFQIDKVGNYALVTRFTGTFGTVEDGMWVRFTWTTSNSANAGTFRVVRQVDTTHIWIENPDAVAETFTSGVSDQVEIFSYDDIMPGDTLTIDTSAYGTKNRGTFTVVANSELSNDTTQVSIAGDMEAYTGPTVLGGNVQLIRFLEAEPVRIIKRIWTMGQNTNSSSVMDVIFVGETLANKLTSSAGVSIQPLDKFEFTTDLVAGADAYSYAVGLIGEVNRVAYGDPANPSVYPGVVAAGAQVNISGPLIKRVTVSLAVRLRTGSAASVASDTINRIKSAVASAVNQTPIGTSIAISSLVSAAQGVDGVTAVTVLSPTYASGNDLIAVGSNEKPRVLDLDNDVLVVTVGGQ